jgi:hypothetical protein
MTKSKAVAALESALAAETNPDKRVEIASRLSKALDVQGRERGRRARARRQKKEKKTDPVPTVDLDAEFVMDDYPPILPEPTIMARPVRVVAESPKVELEPEAPAPDSVPRPDGYTRVIAAGSPQEVFDYERGMWVYDENPFSSLGPNGFDSGFPMRPDVIESNSYSNEDGWGFERRDPQTGAIYKTNQREEAERKEREARERDMWEKLYGR